MIGRGGLELELAVSERLDPEVATWMDTTWAAHTRSQYGEDLAVEVPFALTARRQGEVVGVAEGWVRGSEAYLGDLVVAADVRGEGVGSHLLAAFAAEARGRGATALALRTIAGGPAEGFYRDRGFTLAFPLPAWRHGRDFVQLRRAL